MEKCKGGCGKYLTQTIVGDDKETDEVILKKKIEGLKYGKKTGLCHKCFGGGSDVILKDKL